MILIGTGGNLDSSFGTVYRTLDKAFELLEQRGCLIEKCSGWYKTAPVPISSQPWYHNRVFSIKTEQRPQELIKTLLGVEADLGRVRTVKNAARVLDLDLLAYNEEIINEPPETIVPHPRMHLRAFVLYPMSQIAPDWIHPVLKQSISELIRLLPADQEIIKE